MPGPWVSDLHERTGDRSDLGACRELALLALAACGQLADYLQTKPSTVDGAGGSPPRSAGDGAGPSARPSWKRSTSRRARDPIQVFGADEAQAHSDVLLAGRQHI